MRTLLTTAQLFFTAAPMAAQTIWTMGSPWTDLDQVIQMAAPGDVVRLQGMSFPPFALTKGLTLIGPSTIRVVLGGQESQATTIAIPAGQEAHFVDIEFVPNDVFPVFKHRVDVSGAATFEGCGFRGGAPASLITSGSVLLRGCTVSGGASGGSSLVSGGVRIQGGVCHIVDCTLNGADSVFSPTYATYIVPTTTALTVQSGTVYVSWSHLIGGTGMQHAMFGAPQAGSPAVFASGGTLYIDDSQLVAGASPVALPGPSALVGTSNTFHARTLLLGGGGSTTGMPTSGPVQFEPRIVGMRLDPGFRQGLVATLTATAGSAQPLAIFASFDPTPTSHPAVIGAILGSPAQLVPLAFAVPVAGQQVVHALPVPIHPGLLYTALHGQACQLDGNLVRVSPGICGVVH